jgi:hypothetical protein
MSEGKTYGSVVITKQSKQKLLNSTIELMLSWGLDYDEVHGALERHREAANMIRALREAAE